MILQIYTNDTIDINPSQVIDNIWKVKIIRGSMPEITISTSPNDNKITLYIDGLLSINPRAANMIDITYEA